MELANVWYLMIFWLRNKKTNFLVQRPAYYIAFFLMPRSHTHGSPRRFHYESNPTDDPGNDNIRSPIQMHNASTTTYDYGSNTDIYGLIRIATEYTCYTCWPHPKVQPRG